MSEVYLSYYKLLVWKVIHIKRSLPCETVNYLYHISHGSKIHSDTFIFDNGFPYWNSLKVWVNVPENFPGRKKLPDNFRCTIVDARIFFKKMRWCFMKSSLEFLALNAICNGNVRVCWSNLNLFREIWLPVQAFKCQHCIQTFITCNRKKKKFIS